MPQIYPVTNQQAKEYKEQIKHCYHRRKNLVYIKVRGPGELAVLKSRVADLEKTLSTIDSEIEAADKHIAFMRRLVTDGPKFAQLEDLKKQAQRLEKDLLKEDK